MDSSSEEEKAQMGVDSSVLTDVKVQGVSAFSINDILRLEIEGGPEPIVFKPKPETIFGRRDPATGAMPDVDLTPFAGYRMGVSRRHAAIRQGEEQSLNIWDLGSSNGTYLNGQKLSAHRPYRLHDGDELRLGQMVIRIRFQTEDTIKFGKAEDMGETRAAKAQAVGLTDKMVPASAEENPPITTEIKDTDLPGVQKTEPAVSVTSGDAKPEEPQAEVQAEVKEEQPVPKAEGAVEASQPEEVQQDKNPSPPVAPPPPQAASKDEPPITGEISPEHLPDHGAGVSSPPEKPALTGQSDTVNESEKSTSSEEPEQMKPDEENDP